MAGAYPDAPGRKMRHYGDGTICLYGTARSSGLLTGPLVLRTGASTHLELVDHDNAQSGSWGYTNGAGDVEGVIFIFPELRDIDGTYIASNTSWDSAQLSRSADTTNGIDGTWTSVQTVQATMHSPNHELPGHADDIYAWAQTGQRAVQWTADEAGIEDRFLRAFEIYGEIASGETPDRILIIDDLTALEFGVDLDAGDWPRGAAWDKLVRLKNNSASQANTIDVARGNDEGPQNSSTWWTFDNGAGFGSSFQVTSLAASAEDTFTIRMTIPTTAVVGLYEAWMSVAVSSFT